MVNRFHFSLIIKNSSWLRRKSIVYLTIQNPTEKVFWGPGSVLKTFIMVPSLDRNVTVVQTVFGSKGNEQ